MDNRICDEGVVDTAKQLQETLFSYYVRYCTHHAQAGVSLHVNLNRIERVAGDDAGHSGKDSAAEVFKVLFHRLSILFL